MMRINTDVESSHSAPELSKAETLQKFGLFFQKMGELDLAVSVYQRLLECFSVRFHCASKNSPQEIILTCASFEI